MKIYKELEQGTQEWLKVRKWVITGTKLKWVLWWPKAQLTEQYTLLAEMYVEEEKLNSYEVIERWHELEPIAKAKYESITWNKVEEVWFIVKDNEDWHGLSPDWIVLDEDSGLYTWSVEIKCPMWKNYVKYLLEDKIPDEYKDQVTNYFMVMEDLEWLDFIIYNPDVSSEIKDIHIIRVTRNDLIEDINKAEEKLKTFRKKWEALEDKLKIKDAELCD